LHLGERTVRRTERTNKKGKDGEEKKIEGIVLLGAGETGTLFAGSV